MATTMTRMITVTSGLAGSLELQVFLLGARLERCYWAYHTLTSNADSQRHLELATCMWCPIKVLSLQVELAALEYRSSRLVRVLDAATGQRLGFGEGGATEVVSARCVGSNNNNRSQPMIVII